MTFGTTVLDFADSTAYSHHHQMTVIAVVIAAVCLIGFFVGSKRNSAWSTWVLMAGILTLLFAFWPQKGKDNRYVIPPVKGIATQGPAEPMVDPLIAEQTVVHNPEVHVPREEEHAGFVSSSECRDCHRRQYHTWHDSYHRRMTQPASAEGIVGNFDGQVLTNHSLGNSIQLKKELGKHFFRVLTDRSQDEPGPWREVVLTTGSHHTQVYWYPTRVGNTLGMVPFEYHKEAQQWIPRAAAFLKPPGVQSETEIGRWNDGCINCHTTGPHSGGLEETKVYNSKVGEFGIACEACHGPGEQHVSLQRKAQIDGVDLAKSKDPIVNPVELIHQRSSEVCGRCHSIPYDRRVDMTELDYRPGEVLDEKRFVVTHGDQKGLKEFLRLSPRHQMLKGDIALDLRFSFWQDGMIRLAGREFVGLINSPCHEEGTMSCFSCHKMHQATGDARPAEEWADDQLKVGMRGNKACTQCHEAEEYGAEKHTHHAVGSVGANCYNCHMPHTSYGLLKAVRSHTVSSPTVTETVEFKRQNACNICHTDKSLGWTSKYLKEWYATDSPSLTAEQQKLSAMVVATLKGDAIDRAFAAWYLGWAPAQQASGTDWMPPFLAVLMEDDYDVVRYMAYRSLKSIPGYEDLKFDYVSSETDRAEVVAKVREQWNVAKRAVGNVAVLLGDDGAFDEAGAQRLLNVRDNTRVLLTE